MEMVLLAGGVIVLSLGLIVWLAIRSGRQGAETDILKGGIDKARRGKEIEDEVARLSKSALVDKLRKRR